MTGRSNANWKAVSAFGVNLVWYNVGKSDWNNTTWDVEKKHCLSTGNKNQRECKIFITSTELWM